MTATHRPPAPVANAGAAQLGDLLRSRRERVRPADVGLPAGTRRRVKGLRREEVAALASISTTYYTFLEQGRDVTPSRQVLDALADALRMSPAERGHLHGLAHGRPNLARPTVEVLAPSVAALVERLDPHPTYVTGKRFDVLAANRAAQALWTDWAARPPDRRNMLWWMFTDPAARTILVEWEAEATALLARFRSAADRNPHDPAFAELIERLCDASPQARTWWGRHDIVALASGSKLLRHPELGTLTLQHVVLQIADDPEQKLVTFTTDDTNQARIAQILDRTTSFP